jgi:hypothetical protein
MTTLHEQEDVIERLQWHDDDVVCYCHMALGNPRQSRAQMRQKEAWITGDNYKVLMPFLSADGVLFTPQDMSSGTKS